MARVCILNWTAEYHAGCAAVCESLERLLEGHEIVDRVATSESGGRLGDADLVVLNGEGTLHHDRPHAEKFLGLLGRAQMHGIKTAIVNATWDAMSPNWLKVVQRCDFVSAREPWPLSFADWHRWCRDRPYATKSLAPVAWGGMRDGAVQHERKRGTPDEMARTIAEKGLIWAVHTGSQRLLWAKTRGYTQIPVVLCPTFSACDQWAKTWYPRA